MDVSNNNYFYTREQRNSDEYDKLREVYVYCEKASPESEKDLLRRVSLLDIDDSCERQLQGGNFVSELFAFHHFIGSFPEWIPESSKKGTKTPDFYILKGGKKYPIEVKTLNLPKDEGDSLRSKDALVREIDITSPELSFETKIIADCKDAIAKFKDYLQYAKDDDIYGTIWLSYIPSQMTRLEEGAITQMVERIKKLAEKITPKEVEIIVENAWSELK